MENFYIIVTNAGLAKIAEATANQTTVKLTEMAVGDSNGNYYEPQASQTMLKNEKWRGAINKLEIDSSNSQQVIVQSLIPADIGGFTIREVGVFDESGILIAVGKFPETEKVLASQGASRELYLQVILKVSNKSSIVLQVDPNLVMVTQSYVDNKLNDKADKKEFDEHQADYVSHPGTGTTTNSGNAFAVTLNPVPISYVDKMGLILTINADSTGSSTINVNGLGAKPIKKTNGNDVSILKAGGIYSLRYNASTGNFILQGEGGEYGTASASDVLAGKTIGTENGLIEGKMIDNGGLVLELNESDIPIPIGFHNGDGIIKTPLKLVSGTDNTIFSYTTAIQKYFSATEVTYLTVKSNVEGVFTITFSTSDGAANDSYYVEARLYVNGKLIFTGSKNTAAYNTTVNDVALSRGDQISITLVGPYTTTQTTMNLSAFLIKCNYQLSINNIVNKFEVI